jgi:hypothetical protein
MNITVTIQDDEVRTLLERMPGHVFGQTKIAITTAVFRSHAIISENARTKLHIRTGALRRSITPIVTGNDMNTLVGSVWSDMIYAPLQEVGGTVRPKNNKYAHVPGGPYINIPLAPNKTPAGVMRSTSRQVFTTGGYIAKSQAGNWIVFSHDDKPMFILVKQAVVPPRLGMQKAQEAVVPELLGDLEHILDGL